MREPLPPLGGPELNRLRNKAMSMLVESFTLPSLDTMSSMWRNGTEVGRYAIEYPGSLPRASPLFGRNNGLPHSLKFGRSSSLGVALSPVIILRGEDAIRLNGYIVGSNDVVLD